MGFDKLTAAEIAAGKRIRFSLMNKIRLNFESHEERLKGSAAGMSSLSNGSLDSLTSGVPDYWTVSAWNSGTYEMRSGSYAFRSQNCLRFTTPVVGGSGVDLTSDMMVASVGYGHMVSFWAAIVGTTRPWSNNSSITSGDIVEPSLATVANNSVIPYQYNAAQSGTMIDPEPPWEDGTAVLSINGVFYYRYDTCFRISILEYDNNGSLLGETVVRDLPAILTRQAVSSLGGKTYHKYAAFVRPTNPATSMFRVKIRGLLNNSNVLDVHLDEVQAIPHLPHLVTPTETVRLKHAATQTLANWTVVDSAYIYLPPGAYLSNIRFAGSCQNSSQYPSKQVAAWRLKVEGTYSNEWPGYSNAYAAASASYDMDARFTFKEDQGSMETGGRHVLVELEATYTFTGSPTLSIDVGLVQGESGAFGEAF